ncbi:unnamed protein product [Lampetra planeri]
MELHVNNVSATAASVGWSPSWRCPQGWAPRAVHRPDWERPLAGTSPRRLQREERVAPGRHRVALEGLTPLTGYIACVSCAPVPPLLLAPPQQHQQQRSSQQPHLARQQPAPHGGEQGACVAFHTTGPDLGNRKKEMAIAIWVSSSVLLLLIAAFLLYGCLRIWCRRRRELGKGTGPERWSYRGGIGVSVLVELGAAELAIRSVLLARSMTRVAVTRPGDHGAEPVTPRSWVQSWVLAARG